ncbi:hypothetical protein IWQ48_001301 [Labrenzia sp. EL_13]|nr:hypothetical protein [Labrenzia sp. EL_13]
MPSKSELVQAKINAFLGAGTARIKSSLQDATIAKSLSETNATSSAEIGSFSVFDLDANRKASAVAAQFALLADKDGDGELDGLFEKIDELSAHYGKGLVWHALKLFMTHHPKGRMYAMPSLLSRMAPSNTAKKLVGGEFEIGSEATPKEENRVNWWREDALMNEHHEHWHIVYNGFPAGNGNGPVWPGGEVRDRQGEMFFYMHQQMLARYNCERASVGLPPVRPYDDYRSPMTEGYDPGQLLIGGQKFVKRPPDATFDDLTYIMSLERRRDRNLDAAESGILRNGATLIELEGHEGSDLLGAANEPSQDSVDLRYYSHHGGGHYIIAAAVTGDQNEGVVWHTHSNLRDPMFWRWHQHIDDIHYAYQRRIEPHSFSDAPQSVSMLDVAFIRESGMPPDLDDVDPQEWIAAAISGGSKIEEKTYKFQYNDSDHEVTTASELLTDMKFGRFKMFGADGKETVFKYPYLQHERFGYVVSVQNDNADERDVTVRIFLGPEDGRIDGAARRRWIEMDKFKATLAGGTTSILFRADTESSVIRKDRNAPNGVIDPSAVTDIITPADPTDYDGYCTCGWPHHLLLPRGTEKGQGFKLFVVITDWRIDYVPEDGACGSMSFCGARDRYPDTRPMGYPFDREFATEYEDAEQLATDNQNMFVRDLSIRCDNSEPTDKVR